jgi:hypothetical protein
LLLSLSLHFGLPLQLSLSLQLSLPLHFGLSLQLSLSLKLSLLSCPLGFSLSHLNFLELLLLHPHLGQSLFLHFLPLGIPINLETAIDNLMQPFPYLRLHASLDSDNPLNPFLPFLNSILHILVLLQHTPNQGIKHIFLLNNLTELSLSHS